jgi:hypothetical protein
MVTNLTPVDVARLDKAALLAAAQLERAMALESSHASDLESSVRLALVGAVLQAIATNHQTISS